MSGWIIPDRTEAARIKYQLKKMKKQADHLTGETKEEWLHAIAVLMVLAGGFHEA